MSRTAGPSCTLARAGDAADLWRRTLAVRFEQIELELGGGDGGEAHLLQRPHGIAQHLARIGEERLAARGRHRQQHLRGRHLGPRHGRERAGHRGRDRIRIAVAAAVVDAVEGLALGVEQHGRAAEVDARP